MCLLPTEILPTDARAVFFLLLDAAERRCGAGYRDVQHVRDNHGAGGSPGRGAGAASKGERGGRADAGRRELPRGAGRPAQGEALGSGREAAWRHAAARRGPRRGLCAMHIVLF